MYPHIFLYLFWELSLFALACALAALAMRNNSSESQDRGAEFVVCSLIIKLLLGAVIPQTAAFFGGVTPYILYGAAMACALAGGGFWYLLIQRNQGSHLPIFDRSLNSSAVYVCVAIILASPAIGGSITPIIEADSVRYSHWIVGFANGLEHPFSFPYNYAALWESAYVPSLVITNSVRLFAFTSLQAVLLFALASYLLSRRLGLGLLAAGLTALVALFSGHLWGIVPTGVGTLKNDAISAAGIILMVLAAIRFIKDEQINPVTAMLLLGGLAFSAAKSSGPVLAGVIALFLTAFFYKKIININARSVTLLGASVLLFFAASGFYYVRNIYEFHNPFYPYAFQFGPIRLPGDLDPAGTRMIDHIFSLEMWKLFFGIGSDHARKTSYMFQGLLVTFALFPLWLYFFRGRQLVTEAKVIWFLWLVVLVMWLLFLQTPWSAGTWELPYAFIDGHTNVRFTIAHLQLSLILATMLLFSMGRWGGIAGFVLLGVELSGRMHWLYGFQWHGVLETLHPSVTPLVLALAVLTVAAIVFLKAGRLVSVVSFLIALTLLAPWIYEHNKSQIGWQSLALDEIAKELGQCTASSLVWKFNEEPLSVAKLPPNALAAIGSDYNCQYMGTTTADKLTKAASEGGDLPTFVVAATVLCEHLPYDDAAKINAILGDAGYSLLLKHPCSAVYGQAASAALSSEILEQPLDYFPQFPFWLLSGKAGTAHTFAASHPEGIFRLHGNHLLRYEATKDYPVRLRYAASNDIADFHYGPSGFSVNHQASAPQVASGADLFQSLEKADGVWTHDSTGKSELLIEQLDGQTALRLTAKEDDIEWLGVFLPAPQLGRFDNHRFEIEASGTHPLEVNIHAFNFEGSDLADYSSKFVELSDTRVHAVFDVSFGEDRSRDYVAFTALNAKAGQEFIIHRLNVHSSNWPFHLFATDGR